MIKLPEPAAVESTHGCNANGPYTHHKHYYTTDQLKQAIRDALEEAAKVCDQEASEWDKCSDGHVSVQSIATAIRKLKEDI